MGGRSTRAGGSKKVGMEIVKFDHHANKVKEEESPPPPPPPPPPHLSGAYIRSLVKQLTSSRNKDVPSPDVDGVDNNNGDGFGEEALVIEDGSCCQQSPIQLQASDQALVQQQQQQQQHKKQVRRRLHTTRPYQERLLNMAEARREIVTALKFHRASMKQSTEQHHRQPTPPPSVQPQPPQTVLHPPPPPPPQSSFRGRTKCRRNRRVYPSTSASCVESNFSYHPAFGSSSSSISPNNPYCWPSNSHEIPPPHPAITGNLMNLGLPNQRPLGLNLNIHDFTNFETTLYHHNPSSFSTSPSPIPNNNLEAISKQQQEQGNSSEIADPNSSTGNGGGMQQHQGMDEEEIMSEMEWMGEQHQMEWNDTMNLVTSAWWFKFFKTAGEIGPKYKGDRDNDDKEDDPFDQAVVEFPDWLNTANDQSCFPHCLDESSQDPALPCMDIGEIEGMDEEWLP